MAGQKGSRNHLWACDGIWVSGKGVLPVEGATAGRTKTFAISV